MDAALPSPAPTAPTEGAGEAATQPPAGITPVVDPTSTQSTPIGPNLSLQSLQDGTYRMVSENSTQVIDETMYDSLYQQYLTQRTRSIDSSGGLSHHSRQTAFSDEDTIHWGDLDPQLAARLQSDPAALRTWKLMRKPAKQARLDASTAQFAMPTDVPEQQVATGSQDPPNITTNNLKTAIEEYRNPALQELHSQLQYQLQSLHKTLAAAQATTGFSEQSVATEMHKRSVIVHGLPPFVSKKAIDDNLWYLLGLCDMKLENIQSMTNHLLTSSAGFFAYITFLREAQAKLFLQSFARDVGTLELKAKPPIPSTYRKRYLHT